jgi:hypothetical protein
MSQKYYCIAIFIFQLLLAVSATLIAQDNSPEIFATFGPTFLKPTLTHDSSGRNYFISVGVSYRSIIWLVWKVQHLS